MSKFLIKYGNRKYAIDTANIPEGWKAMNNVAGNEWYAAARWFCEGRFMKWERVRFSCAGGEPYSYIFFYTATTIPRVRDIVVTPIGD